MTTPNLLQRLRDNRAALLTCEAIGWLHMAGKAHPKFIRQQASDASTNDRENAWNELTWATNLYTQFSSSPVIAGKAVTPKELFEKHRGRSDDVLGLLQAAHAMASGIEKNSPADYQKQPSQETWLTSAFGHPVRNLLEQRPGVLADDAWAKLEQRIVTLATDLVAKCKSPNDLGAWRDGAIGANGWLREAFTSTLAETRVPNNDVTLWDQSYIAAALFKAAAAGAVLTGSGFEWGNGIKQNTRWRVLTVGIGAEHYASRAVRIGDWTGTRAEIALFFDEVCQLIEVDLAVGACVYRDERVLAFTFPGQRSDSKGSFDDAPSDSSRTDIESSVDELARKHSFETPPRVGLSRSTRSFIVMAREIEFARKALEVPIHRSWSIGDDGSSGRHVCPVSLVRAQAGGSATKQGVSSVCQARRTGRRAAWEERGGDTIWITEVADENDRVALLTFSLDLGLWLDGSHVDSLRAQSVAEWRRNNAVLNGQDNPIDSARPPESLQQHVEGFVRNPKTNNGKLTDPVMSSLNDGFAHETSLQDFFKKVVEDRTESPEWSALTDSTRASWLAHQLFRKNASPGRVHRFWRTTQTFFREALSEFRRLARSSEEGPYRMRRLKLTVSGDTAGLRDGEIYAGHLSVAPNEPFEILCRKNEFVTVCNLARVLGPNDDASRLCGVTFEAKGDDGRWQNLIIDKAEVVDEPLSTYMLLIVLEENPERFRVLVPLASAEACVEHAIGKWKKEMARVWDRLPLRVGLVAFPRKTSFQAVIEATRNLEDDLASGGVETWRVKQVDTSNGVTVLSFVRPDDEHEFIEVPAQLPDGRDDVYYPNLAVESAAPKPHDFTAPHKDGSSTVYRWAPELEHGDGVVVAPARYASIFLDTTARRFEQSRVWPLADWSKHQEIWRTVTESAPSPTAARAVEHLLREARERWTDPDGAFDEAAWHDWIRAVLANEWNVRGSQLDALVAGANRGLLEQVLSWNLHVLKRTTGENDE